RAGPNSSGDCDLGSAGGGCLEPCAANWGGGRANAKGARARLLVRFPSSKGAHVSCSLALLPRQEDERHGRAARGARAAGGSDSTMSRSSELVWTTNGDRGTVARAGEPMSVDMFLLGLAEDPAFRASFTEVLRAVPHAAFCWETPPILSGTLDR